MSDMIEIGMGKLGLADSPNLLSTSGVGSCMAVCLYDRNFKVGALAHIMLPRHPAPPPQVSENDHKYADIALAVMVSQLEAKGVKREQLVAKIAGGASMFPGISGRSERIGEKNILAVKTNLEVLQIPLEAESTGGTSGRAVVFDLCSGIVNIKITL